MAKKIGSNVQILTIDATIAAYDIPAVIIRADGKSIWTRITRNNQITATYQKPSEPFPGNLKAISGTMVNALAKVYQGRCFYPFVMPNDVTITMLPTLNPIQGKFNRSVRWSGDCPIGYGFGFIFFDTLYNTDLFELSSIYEIEV